MSVCVITLGDLCWVSRRLVQGEDERGGQSREVVRPLLSWMFGLQIIPSHSISLSHLRDLGSDQDKQLAHTRERERKNSRRE